MREPFPEEPRFLLFQFRFQTAGTYSAPPPHQSKVLGREGDGGGKPFFRKVSLPRCSLPVPLHHSGAEGFLDGGDPGADLAGRVLSEGVHDALPLGDGGNLLRVGPADNGFLDFHHFENTDPA